MLRLEEGRHGLAAECLSHVVADFEGARADRGTEPRSDLVGRNVHRSDDVFDDAGGESAPAPERAKRWANPERSSRRPQRSIATSTENRSQSLTLSRAQCRQQFGHIIGQRCFPLSLLSRRRMDEGETNRMECLAMKMRH